MSALLTLAAAVAAMPPAFHGDWAPTAAACADKYAHRKITGPLNTEGDYWGAVKSVEVIDAQHIVVREGDDDFGVMLTADYLLGPDGKTLTLRVLDRSGSEKPEAPYPLVRCETAHE